MCSTVSDGSEVYQIRRESKSPLQTKGLNSPQEAKVSKHENLTSIPRNYIKNPGMVVHTCNVITEEIETTEVTDRRSSQKSLA